MQKFSCLLFIALCLFVKVGISYAGLSDGLVAYYPFNGNANDESGNGHNGTVLGATLIEDRDGNVNSAYSFDGINDWITIPLFPLFATNKFSVFAWVKVSEGNSGGICLDLFTYRNAGGLRSGCELNFARTYFLVRLGVTPPPNDAIVGFNAINTIKDDNWHQIGFVKSDTSLGLYYDGCLIYSEAFNLIVNEGTRDYVIGGWNGNEPMYFQGCIDDVRIYNRALSFDEINEVSPLCRSGCVDTDLDGVINIWDACAGTPEGAVTDSNGCKVLYDADNNGKVSLPDAIYILQTLVGLPNPTP